MFEKCFKKRLSQLKKYFKEYKKTKYIAYYYDYRDIEKILRKIYMKNYRFINYRIKKIKLNFLDIIINLVYNILLNKEK